jgi:hypothetical protein
LTQALMPESGNGRKAAAGKIKPPAGKKAKAGPVKRNNRKH